MRGKGKLVKPGAENRHHQRTLLTKFRVLREGRTLAGTSDMATALRLLAVLSDDGRLDGYELVVRGGAK